MFRNVNSDGQSSSSATGIGVAPVGLDSKDNSWIALVSRPLSLLQKLLPGRLRSPALAESGPGWFPGDLRTSFVQEENEFLRQLDDILPITHHAPPHLTYLRCQHEAAVGLPVPGGHLPWITPESVQETGLQSAAEISLDICQQTQMGYFSNIRTVLNQVLLSSQEVKPAGGKDCVPEAVKSRLWWSSFLGRDESCERGLLSELFQAKQDTETACPQTETVSPTISAEITDLVFVQRGCSESMLGENTGPSDHKEEPTNNGGLHTVQNTGGSTADHLSCSNTVLPAPDQDHGYSSLEEEQSQRNHLCKARALGEDLAQQGADTAARPPANMIDMEEEAVEESTETVVLSAPQNKTIAFIMGCPCSDDDSNQSDHQSTEDEEEDDDGFDSEGSSDCYTSSDEEEEETSDSEPDSESERLWNSLSRTLDPYNPQNFTACLHTGSTRPRTIPTPLSSTQSSPASSPEASPPLTSSSPPSSQDSWDDSASASEVDEAESLRLLSSFSCSSDPYSPFNFQAPLRTRGPTGPLLKTKTRAKMASQTQSPSSPPEYRQQEAEERMDSGFSESNTTVQTCRRPKKVRFRDDVEEFFASCGEEEEDRHGPWEELARDRCRFLRRCQEVEQSIGFCLQPQHRLLVYRRLSVLQVQKA
ncbi:protein phosphatase 1 regulatory subunit 15B [Melanotaenia boesemani]|uniref:protein phosphatase 1 regulatory subunit 15B n=1 Tax=Melanotaenia boesemani TaxID=1250792 RepID=UPI001C058D48|nr:protein phosphatase 1 regulatory subunit 15B [Melanotaenia boesemani]